jgi:hypothetical protein
LKSIILTFFIFSKLADDDGVYGLYVCIHVLYHHMGLSEGHHVASIWLVVTATPSPPPGFRMEFDEMAGMLEGVVVA